MSLALPPPTTTGPVHEPEVEDREPATRYPKLMLWDRIKVSVIIIGFILLAAAYEHSQVPIMSFGEALTDQLRAKWWLLVILGLEILRQIHILVSEHRAAYHQWWQEHVWGAWNDRMARVDPWKRYRLGRAFKWTIGLSVIVLILSWQWGTSFFETIAEAPGRIWDFLFVNPIAGMPLAFSLILAGLYGVFSIFIFFAIFMFGGIDYFKVGEIKTRFTDVWGQDAVLGKVKEAIDFLDRPEEIEAKGGYVPGGMLLWGPPGTGKTLMAEAVAGETGKPYAFVDPQAFVQTFIGVAPMKIKWLYRRLRKSALKYGGVIVFFDEADVLGNRGQLAAGGGFNQAGAPDGLDHLRWLSEPAQQLVVTQALTRAPAAGPEPEGRRRDGIIMGGMGGGGMGTLQALLTEMSGLRKPRGFFSRRIRSFLNMKPKVPPKYRILHIFATNMPNALDEAMLRPGRIDRIYKVGYPSKDGRKRTYEGYFDRIRHNLTEYDMERLAIMTPYATGATIKDLVNESLILATRDERETVTWQDVLAAKQIKDLGLPEDVEYIERERHAIAIHEACHAVAAYRTRQHWTIDVATIEKGGTYLGMVSSVRPEDQFTRWRSEYESDIVVSVASLAGERFFYGGDNSSGVSGDLESATTLATFMEGWWGMGSTIAAQNVTKQLLGVLGGPGRPASTTQEEGEQAFNRLGARIEDKLQDLFDTAVELLEKNRTMVLATAHALETHKTISGEDVAAIMENRKGPKVDGRKYHTPSFAQVAEHYHRLAVEAHHTHTPVEVPLPTLPDLPEPVAVGVGWGAHGNGRNGDHATSPWAPPAARLVPPPPPPPPPPPEVRS